MALTRIQYMGPSSTAPAVNGEATGARTGSNISVGPDGTMKLVATGVASGSYFAADITVGRDGRIIRCNDGQPQINPLTDFEPGTQMIFGNATAPTGWVQVTSSGIDNAMIRLVNSTGGGGGGEINFTEAFGNIYRPTAQSLTHNLSINRQSASGNVGGVNLSERLTGPHQHTFGFTKAFQYQPGGGAGAFNGFGSGWSASALTDASWNPTGTHTHSFSGSTGGANIQGTITFQGTPATQFEVEYFDMIVAQST